MGRDGGTIETKIHSDRLPVVDGLRGGEGQNDVEMPFAFGVNQIGAVEAGGLGNGFGGMLITTVGNREPSCH